MKKKTIKIYLVIRNDGEIIKIFKSHRVFYGKWAKGNKIYPVEIIYKF